MYSGWPSLCLSVRDLDASVEFYQTVGFELVPEGSVEGQRAVLRLGTFRLALFASDIGGNLINIRGADVATVYQSVRKKIPGIPDRPETYEPGAPYEADAAGTCWTVTDPDGNLVFFDTNSTEQGETFKRRRLTQILTDAEQELTALGVGDACLKALRTHVIEPFGDRD